MKKVSILFVFIMLASHLCFAGEPVTSVTPPTTVGVMGSTGDSERIARAFLAHDVVRYNGWLNFQRVMPDGSSNWVNGHFGLSLDGWITYLVIDDVTILSSGDAPLAGLPSNKVGSATLYNINLCGVDGQGQAVINGGFYTKLLLPGDPILVTLHPSYVERFITFDLPDGVNPNEIQIRDSNRCNWGYDSQRGGFSIWADPTATFTYEIANTSTGEVYERGSVGDGPETIPAGDNIVSLAYGGVSALLMDQSKYWENLQNIYLDNFVEREGASVPAKVIMTNAYGDQITINSGNFPADGQIEVREWRPEGEEMPVIATASAIYVNYGDGGGMGKGGGGDTGYYYISLQTPIGYEKLIVTVTSNMKPSGPFSLYFSRGGSGGRG